MAIKRVKRQTQRRKAVRYNLVLNKDKWVRGSDQIKKLRDELSTGSCPVTGTVYTESGMDSSCLDHCHDEGVVRGVLSARSNLWLGSIEKYMKKRLGKNADLVESLEKLVDYLKQSKELEPILHGAIIDAEKTRVSRWKNETIYSKLVEKGLDLKQLNDYDKRDLVELHLQQFIKEKEENV